MELKLIRDSKFELLRIIAITFVYLHHTLIVLGLMKYNGGIVDMPEKLLGISLNTLFIIGVNLFILISGYFSIKLRFSKVLKLLLIILACCTFEFIFSHGAYRGRVLRNILDLHSANPFIPCYISLMLISPLINRALSNFKYKELKIIVILFTIISVFIGFILDNDSVSSNGYNFINYIYVYVLGYFLRVTPKIKTIYLIGIYFTSYFIIILWAYYYKSNYSAFAYNNPFIILLSCSFFLLFSLIKIRSQIINVFAISVFGMFLLENYVRAYCFSVSDKLSIGIMLRNIILNYLILFVLSFIITYVCSKIMHHFSSKLSRLDNKFYIK